MLGIATTLESAIKQYENYKQNSLINYAVLPGSFTWEFPEGFSENDYLRKFTDENGNFSITITGKLCDHVPVSLVFWKGFVEDFTLGDFAVFTFYKSTNPTRDTITARAKISCSDYLVDFMQCKLDPAISELLSLLKKQ